MSTDTPAPTEAPDATPSIEEKLDQLADLFRRRLLDDRGRQATIDDLQSRLDRAEKALAADSLRPFVTRMTLAIERLQSSPPSEDLSASVADELEDILEVFGVIAFGADQTVDARRHEIVSVSGEGSELRVGELLSPGYEKDGVILRPARITAVRREPDAGA